MVSLKRTAADVKEEKAELSSPEPQEYPYGVSIDINEEVMEKLGMTEIPKVGAKITITAKAEVTSARQVEGKEYSDSGFCLQITDLELGSGLKKSAAQSLYGSE